MLFKKVRGVAQPGSALVWGASGRGFKSRRPDQTVLEVHPQKNIFCFYKNNTRNS
jgi:hypothetical protein